ncbi:MAG: TonB-dependent receptor [Phenylobacterium sp.]|jgi:outer membrane receptor for ferrienterochelin and colicins|uniref:TonB-dependent receptor n=1 Tax=Phenylobacterium sp. TaxID=1871053 RepID=UPI002606B11C|nr:TonB-dependent receptor [Phenylobacterium sp.]MDB5496686.1 TonB-dependent receptor [Phenylobacterium sp.]
MSHKLLLLAAASAGALVATAASAQSTAAAPPAAGQVSEIVVTAQRLDAARSTVEPALGATSYSLPQAFINNLPGGANTQLNQVILQAPGAAQDSFGQLHVRGDHGNIQYRLNNVILPEGLQVFGQTLSPRLASNIDLITGALPAQYGLRTAGIINITTKSGFNNGGEVSVYGGSHGVITPSIEYGGSWGATSGFFSGSYTGTDVGIESPDGSGTPLHDHSDQYQAFGYLDHILDDSSRVSAILGTSQQSFQIPNVRGLQPDLGLNVNGRTAFASDKLDQSQREGTTYGIVSYLKTLDKFTFQASAFARYSELRYKPDVVGELLFNGIAQSALKTDLSIGTQLEGAYTLNDAHTIRGGLIVSTDRTKSKTNSQVFFLDAAGNQTSSTPTSIIDNSKATAWNYSVYLQDEWKLTDALTLNYGVRFDQVDAFLRENQLSPRVNLVWTPFEGTTFHAGYSRFFTPPPFELVATETVSKFVGTTAEAPGTQNDLPKSERDNYYDLGVQQKLGALTVGVDAYYKDAKNLIDEGQFGAPIILTPFNYREGYAKGVEFSANYAAGPLNAYANLAISQAKGKDIISSQFNFDPADLAVIHNQFIYLDHDQTYTASGGASYRFSEGTRVSADVLYGSGLRRDGSVPNGDKVPSYTQVNLGAAHDFTGLPGGPLTLRIDVINVFDKKYEIRDGTGVGVGAPQFGPRRGFFAGVSKSF